VQRRLAAILAADVVGYSRLVGEDEAGTLAAFKAHRRALIDPRIAEHGGRIVKLMGDGILAEFPSVVAAVECAVAIQEGMTERNRETPPERRMEFRIGVNLGEVTVEGDDILGDGVNVAARLEGFARPGAVCVSGSVYEQVRNRVAFPFEDFGAQRFKNIAEPVNVFMIQLGDEADPLADVLPVGDELPLPERPSIAILPFKNLGGDAQQDYLADGIRLHIQAMLVKLAGLFLIAPGTTAKYRDSDAAPAQVARELGVRYILEGAVQTAGSAVRITVELTDAAARRVVWAEQYERVLDDGFRVQDEITVEVVKALDVKLASGEKEMLVSTVTNPEALKSFYRGLYHFYKGTKEDNAAARHWFENVTRLQPDSSVGPTYMCFSHWADAFRGWADSREESVIQAARWGEKALKFEVTNGLAHVVLATAELLNRNFDEALDNCQEAIARRPNCPTATGFLAYVLHYCGHSPEAIAKIKESIRLTPVYPPWLVTLLAAAYREAGDIPRSIAAAKHGLSLNPRDLDARLILCSDYVLTGQQKQARELAEEIARIDPAFSLAKYTEHQPYRNRETLQRLVENLREAGLAE
jgi:class 3 adenylate cyclase/TolB-like protein